jgi:hypothetical protein
MDHRCPFLGKADIEADITGSTLMTRFDLGAAGKQGEISRCGRVR